MKNLQSCAVKSRGLGKHERYNFRHFLCVYSAVVALLFVHHNLSILTVNKRVIPFVENREEPLSSSLSRTFDEEEAWIRSSFRAADPEEQEWCINAMTTGNFWKHSDYNGGSQYGGDGFAARNLFWDYMRGSRRGFYVEAGANHYRQLSATFFYDKCLGWDGLCVEPQQRYQEELRVKRSCKVVRACLTKEKTQMMIGGMPAHRGAGAFIRPIPDGAIPENFDKVECAPLEEMIGGKTHVDLFVLDVEGAELPVLDTIDWNRTTFSVLQIETNKIKNMAKLNKDMEARGYRKLYLIQADTIYVPTSQIGKFRKPSGAWQPHGNIVGLKT